MRHVGSRLGASCASEGVSEGLKACFGRCFWRTQFQLQLGHAEVHGPRLQGEAKYPKASPKASKHVLDVASGTRSFSCGSVIQRYMDQAYKAKPSLRTRLQRLRSMFWTLLPARAASAEARSYRYMDQAYKAKRSLRRRLRRVQSMFWTLLLAPAASAETRS